jgi:hypothetical protein
VALHIVLKNQMTGSIAKDVLLKQAQRCNSACVDPWHQVYRGVERRSSQSKFKYKISEFFGCKAAVMSLQCEK